MTRVMIAMDGSDQDRLIAHAAQRLFGDDTDFWAVNVARGANRSPTLAAPPVGAWTGVTPVMYGGAYPYRVPEIYTPRTDAADLPAEVDAREARAGSVAEDSGLDDAHVVAEVGDPADAIRRAATEHHADVIVVGTHDRSWWSELVQPSVSGDLVDDSPVPVLLVREGAMT